MTPHTSRTNDEAQIRRLIAEEAADIAAQETRDLAVHVKGDLALAQWRFRFSGTENGCPAARTWMRNTVAYQRSEGEWRAVPGHWSVPFNPERSTVAEAQ